MANLAWMPLQKFFPYTLVLVSLAEEGVVGSEFVSIISSSGRARSALFSNRQWPACSLFFKDHNIRDEHFKINLQ